MRTLPTSYQQLIHISRYSRWMYDKERRETWEESVTRYIDFFKGRFPLVDEGEWVYLKDSIMDLKVMPSMRCMATAGEALDISEMAGYNCAAISVDDQSAFDETLYVLMCGTGMGFSVESKFTEQLPKIAPSFASTNTTIKVGDSKKGWAYAIKELISLLYSGQEPKFDVSLVRGKGMPLKTFGGRSSGPGVLVDLYKYLVNTFRRARGRRLYPIEAHDIMCKIAEIVVVGGVRRSALISLSDLSDPYMPNAKAPFHVKEYTLLGHKDNGNREYSITVDDKPYGDRSLIVELSDYESELLQSELKLNWYHVHPERALANNSVAYTEKPGPGEFMKEWLSLYNSHSGERGIFSRDAAKKHIDRLGMRDSNHEFLCNPCSEILLRSKQCCNLSEVILRSDDNYQIIKDKVRVATMLGTLQSTLTNFDYVGPKWKKNAEEERLLGVSITGIMDNRLMSSLEDDGLSKRLNDLRDYSVVINKEFAKILGINQSVAITAVKPSGTVSQLCNTSSGIHPRFAPYYIRRIRNDLKDPVSKLLIDQGVEYEKDIMNESTAIFSFRQKAPKGSVMTKDRTAIEQLKLWKIYATRWCHHKPSITVYVKEGEWLEVGAWVYENFDIMSGVSFLPFDGGTYQQAPYEEITEEQYNDFKEIEIDWSRLSDYEKDDRTISSQELACTGSSCEI